MSDFDNRDEEEKKETSLEENKGKEPSDKKEEKTDKPEKEYEDVCFICRRPESKAARGTICPIISVSATTACTGLWMQ